MPPRREEFWNFCLEVYAAAGVKDACLEAQDSFGADVNLLLLFLWHDREGLLVSDTAMNALLATSGRWQQETLAPHRERRRAAKGTGRYESLLRQELDLERQAQAALLGALGRSEPVTQPANADRYIHRLGARETLLSPLRAAIRRA